ncbi:hypothetical protein ACOSQ3_026813 [Xanthoceras sorbifolium]
MTSLSLNVGNFVTIKLTQSNYPLWREQVLGLAESQDLVGYLTNETPIPTKYTTSYSNTTETGNITPQLTTEFVAWQKSNRLLQEFTLRQQLIYLRKDDNKTIGDHIHIFKGLCDNLPAIGKPIPDKEKCVTVANGHMLPPGIFHDATTSLSGIYYPTSHLFLFEALNIVGALNECSQINELVPCVYAMRERWINYYRDIPVIYTLASVFDPRNKFNSLYEFFTLYYQSLGIMDIDVSGLYNNVRNLFYSLEHATNFPILAIIAKQIFGTPVSTVAVEQEFSAGGNVLDERRALLSPDSIQIQVCVDDWTKATYRQQELDLVSDDNDFFDTNDDTTATEGTSDD